MWVGLWKTLYRIKINQNNIKQHSKICRFDGTINENLESIIIIFFISISESLCLGRFFWFSYFQNTQKTTYNT